MEFTYANTLPTNIPLSKTVGEIKESISGKPYSKTLTIISAFNGIKNTTIKGIFRIGKNLTEM